MRGIIVLLHDLVLEVWLNLFSSSNIEKNVLSSSYLSQHFPVISIPVQGHVLVQDPQGVLFKDGCDVHCALHCRDWLVEDSIHKQNPLFRGCTCRTENSITLNQQVDVYAACGLAMIHLHNDSAF